MDWRKTEVGLELVGILYIDARDPSKLSKTIDAIIDYIHM